MKEKIEWDDLTSEEKMEYGDKLGNLCCEGIEWIQDTTRQQHLTQKEREYLEIIYCYSQIKRVPENMDEYELLYRFRELGEEIDVYEV